MVAVVIQVFDSEARTTSEYSFNSSPVRIGRNPLNDLTLPFPFVSGWHAVVRVEDGGARFFDLGSTNGTLWNGRRVQAGEPVEVGDGLSVTIGKIELRVYCRPEAHVAASVAPPRRSPDHPGAYFPTDELPAQPAPLTSMPGSVPPSTGLATGSVPPVSLPPMGSSASPSGSRIRSDTPRPGPAGTAEPRHATVNYNTTDVHQLVNRLRPLYDGFRHSWGTLHADLVNSLGSTPPESRSFALSILRREFPQLGKEPEFEALAAQLGAPLEPSASEAASAGTGVGPVAELARSLLPDHAPPGTVAEARSFLSCVEDILRASAKAFIELQKGQEQFGNEMGVRTIKEFTALHAANTPEAILRYLLDWRQSGSRRTAELVGAYADLMIHQVALINGVMEGVRGLLARLSPEEVERGISAGWPTRAAAIWKHYVERHREIAGEDKSIMSIVFGPEFARAYAEVGGQASRGRG